MRLGFRWIDRNIEIFVCPGNLELSLKIPEDYMRTETGRAIANNFLMDIWTTPGIKIPFGEIACLINQLEAVFSSEASGNGLDQS